MRIVALEASNIKRLKAIDVRFKDGLVVIGGKNDQGKSSTLDAVAMALGGKALVPDKPVRTGQKSGHTIVTLGDGDVRYKVTRTFTSKGTTNLTIEPTDGEPMRSPQTFLDSILGSLSFDPLAFARKMARKEQAEALRQLVGLDTSAVDKEIEALFEQRAEAGREAKRLAGALGVLTKHEDAPDEEESLTDLASAIAKAESDERRRLTLKHEIDTLRAATERAQKVIAEQQAIIEESKERIVAADSEVRFIPKQDIDAMRSRLGSAEEMNRKVRENRSRRSVSQDLDAAEKRQNKFSEQIERRRQAREDAIAACKFPVDGLALDENGVQLGGVPFDQAGGAQQLRISVAMGLAMNPKLKVLLIKDGSLLDDDSLALVAKMADEAGAQVLMERVGEDKHTTILIEDGEVAVDRGPADE